VNQRWRGRSGPEWNPGANPTTTETWEGLEGAYAYDPITPPKLPHELWTATETARFVGDSDILFAFHEILSAIAGNVPIAAKKVPAYRAPEVLVVSNTTNPIMPTANTPAFILSKEIRVFGSGPREGGRGDTSHGRPSYLKAKHSQSSRCRRTRKAELSVIEP
jgi:hypothetical protein